RLPRPEGAEGFRDDGGVVLAEELRPRPARDPRAGHQGDGESRLRAPQLPRHLGPPPRQGPRLLHLHGPPQRRLAERGLPEGPAPRTQLDPGRRRRRDPAQPQGGRPPRVRIAGEEVTPRAFSSMRSILMVRKLTAAGLVLAALALVLAGAPAG